VRQGVRAAIDISDGLIADLGHICAASKVGARLRVSAVPIHPLMREAFGRESLDLALTGGEDYELLFTASERIMEDIKASFGADCPVTVIGEITAGAGVSLLGEDDRVYHLDKAGWDHFQKGG
jgi:thiamine-monophosphate kinase